MNGIPKYTIAHLKKAKKLKVKHSSALRTCAKRKFIVLKKISKRLLAAVVLSIACLSAFALVGCVKTEFKVLFYVDGEVYGTVSTSGSEVLKMPDDPEKADDSFVGWFWDDGTWKKPFTMNSLLNVPLSENLSVYAKWKSFEHEHVFDEQSTNEKYLATSATCTNSATYYFSCACGEKGSEMFDFGGPLGHDFSDEYTVDVEQTCTTDGIRSKHCLNDGCTERIDKEILPRLGHYWAEKPRQNSMREGC